MNVELELERIDGVAAVKIEGGYEEEIVVEIDEELLSRYGISMSVVADRLSRENVNIASGSLEEGGSKLAVRTVNRFTSIEDIENVIVAERGGGGEDSGAGALGSLSLPSMPSMGGGGMGMMGGGGLPGGLGALLGGMGGGLPTGGSSSSETERSAPIRVKDIADVSYQHKDRTEIARLAGTESIKVSVFKEGDANIVLVSRVVRDALETIRQDHRSEPRTREWQKKMMSPVRKFKGTANTLSNLLLNYKPFIIEEEPIDLEHDIKIEVISDQSIFITQAIYSVAQTAIWGSIIAVFILYVFLRNVSSTVIVGIAIPISIVTTFNLMFFKDISFNIMSLGGLALGVGMLVDNSIVVLENILRRRSFEPDLEISAKRGADEVSSAITASTLTNIMVFFPILYLEGMFRQIFGDLAWTVAFSLVCSEAVALSIVPMLTVVMGKSVKLPAELLDEMEMPKCVDEEGKPHTLEEMAERSEQEKSEKEEQEEYPGWEDRKERQRSTLRYRNFRVERERHLIEQGKKPGLLNKTRSCLAYGFLLPWLIGAFIFNRVLKATSAGGGFVLKYPLMVFDAGFSRVKQGYPNLLRKLLDHLYLTTGISVAMALASVGIISMIGWELLPAVDQGEFRIRVELPTGTPIEETNRRIGEMEDKIRSIEGADKYITTVFATVGIGTAEGEGSSEKAENIGEIHVSLVDSTRRHVSDDNIIARVMRGLQDEVDVVLQAAKPQLLSYKAPIEIEIEGTNLDKLKSAAETVLTRVKGIDGILEAESSMEEQNPEVNITIDRSKASSFGLSVSEITDIIRRKIKGEIATNFDTADEQIDVVVELEEQDRASFDRLKRIVIPGPKGDVLLEQVAVISVALGPATITRSENSRVALVRADLTGRPLGDVVSDIEASLEKTVFPPGTNWRITGQNEEMQRSLPSLYLAVALAVALVYIILAAQFESLLHPFVIMFCVPFAMVGLAIILVLTDQTINIFSMIGMLMMIGIGVNDAIVFVTTINIRRDEGFERTEAIVEAGRSRLRPIMITTFTTVFGMVPMALALGPGSELRAPMAITVIGGLTSATVFTLFAIPCLYLVLDKILPRSYTAKGKEVWASCEDMSSQEGGSGPSGAGA